MRSILTAAVLWASVVPAAATQQAFVPSAEVPRAASGGEEEWGTVSDIVFTASAHDFNHLVGFGTEGPTNPVTGARTCAGGTCAWAAGLHLPSGAQILGVRVSACDGDPTQQLVFALVRGSSVPGAGGEVLVPFTGTGIPATPGCATFTATPATPHTVRNDINGYDIVVNSTPGTNIEWSQYRVTYRLQVSPAPTAATFPNDVPPTHPFFRFIEALAAAGITGGCGTGSYCPNSAVTRGEMAVFLATALGLHFPN